MPFCANCGQQVTAVSYTPCPHCGRPSNGAPPRVAAAPVPAKTNTATVLIVVLVGGLVVVAILGILAAIAIPNLLTAMQRSKQKRSMADIRSAATAVEAWATDNGRYPEASTMAELEQQVSPKYIAVLPKLDGWGNPMKYACWSASAERCDSYAFGSPAKDGVFARDALQDYQDGTTTTNFNDDIIFSNGKFVQYPQGIQN